MDYVYAAVFEPNEDGTYSITYPDLPGCISEGKDLADALRMAESALSQMIEYLKDSGQITDLLNIMQAHQSLMELANIRIIKDVANDVNRRVNFEAANLGKTVSASLKQLDDIKYIEEKKGLSYLSGQLREAAALRLRMNEASLVEIGAQLNPPVSKSGVNHRFRKISEIAENIRNE